MKNCAPNGAAQNQTARGIPMRDQARSRYLIISTVSCREAAFLIALAGESFVYITVSAPPSVTRRRRCRPATRAGQTSAGGCRAGSVTRPRQTARPPALARPPCTTPRDPCRLSRRSSRHSSPRTLHHTPLQASPPPQTSLRAPTPPPPPPQATSLVGARRPRCPCCPRRPRLGCRRSPGSRERQ